MNGHMFPCFPLHRSLLWIVDHLHLQKETTMKPQTTTLLLLGLVLSACNSQSALHQMGFEPQTAVGMSGDLGFHDPVLIKAGSTYCGFSTGILRDTTNPGGILVHRSSGGPGGSWTTLGEIPVPAWAKTYGIKHLWAPEIVYNGSDKRYYLYYAASQFGTNNSAIGVTSTTNPCSVSGWTDHGAIKTSRGTDFNAIDPDVGWDSTNGWYMSWGSFFSGIKIQKMSSMTTFTGSITTLATRPGVANNPVEAPSITKRGGFYYLFLSWDACCQGTSSTYKTVVGRANSLFGPYTDKNGKRLDQGGGTLLLQGTSGAFGPGGGDAYQDGTTYYFAHHYYDSAGAPKLAVRQLGWDSANWPVP